jgi:hypothetical protein
MNIWVFCMVGVYHNKTPCIVHSMFLQILHLSLMELVADWNEFILMDQDVQEIGTLTYYIILQSLCMG